MIHIERASIEDAEIIVKIKKTHIPTKIFVLARQG